MLRSVLTRPARIVQHTALGALHTGLNTVASVISTVRGGGGSDSSPVPAPNPAPPRTAPAAKKVQSAPEPAATKAPSVPDEKAAKPGPQAKKAPVKKAPAKKAPAAKKAAPSAVPTPADVAERVARPADEPEHIEVEEVLAYSTGPDVSTTVADEVEGSAKS